MSNPYISIILPPRRGVVKNEMRPIIGFDGLWDAYNVYYYNGVFKVRDGLKTAINPASDSYTSFGEPVGIFTFNDSTNSSQLLLASTKKIYRFDGQTPVGSWQDITPAGWSPSGSYVNRAQFVVWDFGASGGIGVIITNGKDDAVKWTPTAGSSVISTIPKGKTIASIANRIVVGNIRSGTISNDRAIDVSSFNDPSSGWGNVVVLADTPGPIVCIKEMGNVAFVVYKSDSIYMAQATADVYPFTFSMRASGIDGPVSPDAVVDAGNGLHYYLSSRGAVYRFDGVSLQSLGEHIPAYIGPIINHSIIELSYGFYDKNKNFLYFMFPTKGSTSVREGVAIDISNNAMWPIRFTRTMWCAKPVKISYGILIDDMIELIDNYNITFGGLETPIFINMFVTDIGKSFIEHGYDDDGDEIQFYMETGISSFQKENQAIVQDADDMISYKELLECGHVFLADPNNTTINFEVGRTYGFSDPVWKGPYRVPMFDRIWRTHHRLSGRMFAFRYYGSTKSRVVWDYSTMKLGFKARR